ncbi:glycosyltransferase family 2 protein [bacterium SCSIO 12741]|nr:glycosyltransferase family 2 protein [bacterium SCSIO 12741]
MPESNTGPQVTIGLMVYNEAAYIQSTLDSILAQKIDASFEILISDNASDDGTGEMAQEYVQKYPELIKYHRQPRNVGIIQNFNTLIHKSTGKYFILAGAHDLWSPGYVNKLYQAIVKNDNIALVAPKTIMIDEKGEEMDQRIGFVDTSSYILLFRFIATLINNQNGLYGIYNLSILRKTRLQLEMFGSGALMLSEMALIGHITFEPEAIWYRREVREKESKEKRFKRYTRVLYSKKKWVLFPHWKIPLEYLKVVFIAKVTLGQRLQLLATWPLIFVIYFNLLAFDLVFFVKRLFKGSLSA